MSVLDGLSIEPAATRQPAGRSGVSSQGGLQVEGFLGAAGWEKGHNAPIAMKSCKVKKQRKGLLDFSILDVKNLEGRLLSCPLWCFLLDAHSFCLFQFLVFTNKLEQMRQKQLITDKRKVLLTILSAETAVNV